MNGKLLKSTGIRNCYTNKVFYRLSVKLSREEWTAVKEYFKFYNFDGLKGWATTNVIDVAEILVSLRNPKYAEISEKIAEYETRIENHCENDFILDEYIGGRNNLRMDLSELVRESIEY